MITYIRGSLRPPPPSGGDPAVIATPNGDLEARVVTDPGHLAGGDPVLVALSDIEVGVDVHRVALLLGPAPRDGADPSGPIGLASTPVVVLPDRSSTALVLAGARRAGRDPAIFTVGRRVPSLGLRLLEAVGDGAELIVIEDGAGAELRLARVLNGRPLAGLPLDDLTAVRSLFTGLELDVHVPVPSGDEPVRARIQAVLEPLDLGSVHHLVEVDPLPAFEELGRDPDGTPLAELAAAAAGVLAGRLAAANRRWRRDLEV